MCRPRSPRCAPRPPRSPSSAAEPVGLHPLLLTAAAELIAASGLPIDARTGIILAAAGSRDLRAVGAMESLFRTQGGALTDTLGARAVRAAYLDGGRPLGRMRTLMRCVDGCTSFIVVPMVIADGILRDRIVTAAEPPRHPGHAGRAGRHERDGRPRGAARRIRPRAHAGPGCSTRAAR